MAYALIASGEAHRYLITRDEEALTRAMRNADWLADNNDLNDDGLPGWGLPFVWDAFGDDSVNPAYTEYAITTALCAKALLDTYDAIEAYQDIHSNGEIYKARYLEIADASLHSFMRRNAYNSYPDSRIAFWYSLRSEDSYEALNIQAMFAGILQRLSTYPIDNGRAALYDGFAVQVVNYIVDYKQEYGGGWAWNYCGYYAPPTHAPRLNDAVHAAYIVDGLMTYKVYGGKAGDEIDVARLLAGLATFVVDDRVVEGSGEERPARLWGVGYLLYAVSHHFDAAALADSVYACAMNDLWADTHFRFREDDDSNYVRHQAHMLVGLSSYAYKAQ